MPSRFDSANVDGVSAVAGFIELNDKTPEAFSESFYLDVARYTTSTFLRAKLGPALASRGVGPHLFETRDEASRSLPPPA